MGNRQNLLSVLLLASSNISPAILFILLSSATILLPVASQYAFSLNGTSHMRFLYNATPVAGIYGQWRYHSADARQAPPLIIVYNETGAVSCAVQSSIPGVWNSFKFALNATGLLCIINDGASEEYQPLDYQFTTPGNKLVTTAGPQPSRVFSEVLLQIGTGGFAGCIENMTFSFAETNGANGEYLSCDQLTASGFKSPKFAFQQQGVQCGCLFPVITTTSTTTAAVPSTTAVATTAVAKTGLNSTEDPNMSSLIDILEKGDNFTTPVWQENQTLRSLCSPNPCPINFICVETPQIGPGYNCSASLPPPQLTSPASPPQSTLTPPTLNICAANPCRNNGTCIQLDTRDGSTYRCQCLPRFTGQNCSLLINVCDSAPCDNGATCVVNPTDPKGYICKCTDSYWGDNCTRYNPCHEAPCLNNGTCAPIFRKEQDYGYQSFECTCAPGFKGDVCNVSFCKNGGLWNQLGQNCSCEPGYYGLHCDWSNMCEIGGSAAPSCKNGGTCRTVPPALCHNCIAFVNMSCAANDWHCLAAECDANQPCIEVKHAISCECPPTFTGHDCSLPVGIPPPPFETSTGSAMTEGTTATGSTGSSSTASGTHAMGSSTSASSSPSAISTNSAATPETTLGTWGSSTQASTTDQRAGGTRVGEIVGGILGALLAIAVVVGAIFVYKYVRNSRKLKGKYNPAREETQNGNGPPVPMMPIDKEERLI